MTLTTEPVEDDHVLVHQFIRRFGRRPTPDELAAYRADQSRLSRARLRARARVALMLTRL